MKGNRLLYFLLKKNIRHITSYPYDVMLINYNSMEKLTINSN